MRIYLQEIRALSLALLFAAAAGAQDTRPPVILVNGYQALCNASVPSSDTFGLLEQKLTAQGIKVVFFNNCQYQTGLVKPGIEELGAALGNTIRSIGAPQVDLIAHSMGGLIVRAYLSGKQAGGGFKPPVPHRVRKVITLATPHYGLLDLVILLGGNDPQISAMTSGSDFLWDLGSWNQGFEDLRQVDALTVVANRGGAGTNDGVVPATSASLSAIVGDERVRVVPYCHTDGIPAFQCNGAGVANIDSDTHPVYQIISSFLSGTTDWKTIGTPPSQDPVLPKYSGIFLAYKNSNDAYLTDIASINSLNKGPAAIFSAYLLATGKFDFDIKSASAPTTVTWNAIPSTHSLLLVKAGPQIGLVAPSAGLVKSLSRTPGMLVSIYGKELTGGVVTFGGQTLTLLYSGATQINALLPENASGYAELRVQTPAGRHSVNLLIEDAVPAVFALNGGGTGPAAALRADYNIVGDQNPLHAGDAALIYLTGLGATTQKSGLDYANVVPTVTIDGKPATLLYAGRAPGFPGLDQLNVIVPDGVSPGNVSLVVTSAGKVSNTTTLAIR
jgi:uncharacterized protein (TIGR03437 family)